MKASQATIYTCTRCGRPVRASADDPIHVITQGKFCSECLGPAHRGEPLGTLDKGDGAQDTPEPTANPTPAPGAPKKPGPTRSESMRARWAKMSPEEKAARTAHLKEKRTAPAEVQAVKSEEATES